MFVVIKRKNMIMNINAAYQSPITFNIDIIKNTQRDYENNNDDYDDNNPTNNNGMD